MESLAIVKDRATQEAPQLSFAPEDMEGIIFPNNDALVIRTTIANYEVARVLVDSRSSVNIFFSRSL